MKSENLKKIAHIEDLGDFNKLELERQKELKRKATIRSISDNIIKINEKAHRRLLCEDEKKQIKSMVRILSILNDNNLAVFLKKTERCVMVYNSETYLKTGKIGGVAARLASRHNISSRWAYKICNNCGKYLKLMELD